MESKLDSPDKQIATQGAEIKNWGIIFLNLRTRYISDSHRAYFRVSDHFDNAGGHSSN